jgi:predicted RNA-binding Zn-ribbon protein involved in translation (DUF1610 family)
MIKKSQNSIEKNKKNGIILVDYKCPHCGKLMFKYKSGTNLDGLEIKCGRCKKVNII